MDQSKLYENLPVALLFVVLIMIQVAPEPFKPFLLYGGMFGCIGMMVAIEVGFKVKAAEFQYILLILRPLNVKLNVFIKKQKNVQTRLYDPENQMYETGPIELAEKVDHPHYKTIKQIIFKHQLPWTERMFFMPGRAIFRGYPIDHNSTAIVTAYEPETSKAQVEHLEPILVCTITEAPNDWNIDHAQPMAFEDERNMVNFNGGDIVPATELSLPADVTREADGLVDEAKFSPDHAKGVVYRLLGIMLTLKRQRDDAKKEAVDWKRRYSDDHQLRIRQEGETEELRNEFQGALSRTRDVRKLVYELFIMALSAHADINEGAKEYRVGSWFKITRNIVLLVLGGLSIYFFATNESLRAWVSGNQALIIIAVICIAVIAFYAARRRK